jgi:hypothetical protein
MNYIEEFKKVEVHFAIDVLNYLKRDESIVNHPTELQDMYEHWDIELLDTDLKGKYDVKALRKVNRHDSQADPTIQWIELLNVNGNKGWLFGRADYIVFEHEKDWVIVKRKDLIDYIKLNTQNDICLYPEIHKLYRRRNRDDLITLVPFSDLIQISYKILPKY